MFRLLYHPAVAREDVPRLGGAERKRIASAIEKKLTRAPELYGVPLRGTLQGYWKLRVGDYRVVFKVKGSEVWILGVGHRKDIYERRLSKREAR